MDKVKVTVEYKDSPEDDPEHPFVVKFIGTPDQAYALPAHIFTGQDYKNTLGKWNKMNALGEARLDMRAGTWEVPVATAEVAIKLIRATQEILETAFPQQPFTLEGIRHASDEARRIAQKIGQGRR